MKDMYELWINDEMIDIILAVCKQFAFLILKKISRLQQDLNP